MRYARWLLVASGLAGLWACSSPTDEATSVSSASAASVSAAAAEPASNDGANGVSIDPGWVVESPVLTQLLQAGSPACLRREAFSEYDGKTSHSYEVYAPSVPQAELERRFAAASGRAGLEIRPHPAAAADPRAKILGSGVANEEVGLWSAVHDGRVVLSIYALAPARRSVPAIAEAARLESWELVKSLGEHVHWRDVSFKHGARGLDVEWQLQVPTAQRATIDEWAKQKRLERDGDGWIRKVSSKDPDATVIVISAEKEGRVSVFESRAIDMLAPACRAHPSRAAESKETGGAKTQPRTSSDAKIEDDLMREMMGE